METNSPVHLPHGRVQVLHSSRPSEYASLLAFDLDTQQIQIEIDGSQNWVSIHGVTGLTFDGRTVIDPTNPSGPGAAKALKAIARRVGKENSTREKRKRDSSSSDTESPARVMKTVDFDAAFEEATAADEAGAESDGNEEAFGEPVSTEDADEESGGGVRYIVAHGCGLREGPPVQTDATLRFYAEPGKPIDTHLAAPLVDGRVPAPYEMTPCPEMLLMPYSASEMEGIIEALGGEDRYGMRTDIDIITEAKKLSVYLAEADATEYHIFCCIKDDKKQLERLKVKVSTDKEALKKTSAVCTAEGEELNDVIGRLKHAADDSPDDVFTVAESLSPRVRGQLRANGGKCELLLFYVDVSNLIDEFVKAGGRPDGFCELIRKISNKAEPDAWGKKFARVYQIGQMIADDMRRSLGKIEQCLLRLSVDDLTALIGKDQFKTFTAILATENFVAEVKARTKLAPTWIEVVNLLETSALTAGAPYLYVNNDLVVCESIDWNAFRLQTPEALLFVPEGFTGPGWNATVSYHVGGGRFVKECSVVVVDDTPMAAIMVDASL